MIHYYNGITVNNLAVYSVALEVKSYIENCKSHVVKSWFLVYCYDKLLRQVSNTDTLKYNMAVGQTTASDGW